MIIGIEGREFNVLRVKPSSSSTILDRATEHPKETKAKYGSKVDSSQQPPMELEECGEEEDWRVLENATTILPHPSMMHQPPATTTTISVWRTKIIPGEYSPYKMKSSTNASPAPRVDIANWTSPSYDNKKHSPKKKRNVDGFQRM